MTTVKKASTQNFQRSPITIRLDNSNDIPAAKEIMGLRGSQLKRSTEFLLTSEAAHELSEENIKYTTINED